MRGKVDGVRQYPADGGITPAYAGKSDRLTNGGDNFGDHPRLCGEKVRYAPQTDQLQGSPPPMRGKGHSHIS